MSLKIKCLNCSLNLLSLTVLGLYRKVTLPVVSLTPFTPLFFCVRESREVAQTTHFMSTFIEISFLAGFLINIKMLTSF